MALTRTSRGSNEASISTTVTVASFTPSASALLVTAVFAYDDEGGLVVNDLGCSDSQSHTWTAIGGVVETVNNGAAAIRYFRTETSGSPAAMTVTGSKPLANYQIHAQVIEWTGHDSASPIGTSQTGENVTSLTLPANPASTSEVLGVGAAYTDGALEFGTGFTEIYDLATSYMSHSQARGGSTSTSVPWGTATGSYVILAAIEIKAAAAGGGAARVVGTGLTESRLLQRTRLARASRHMDGWMAHGRLIVPRGLAA